MAIAQGVSVWVLEAPDGFGDAAVHSHHAIQITASLSGELALSTGSMTLRESILAVKADEPHKFEAHGLLAFLFIEPESEMGRALTSSLFGEQPLVAIDPTRLGALFDPLATTFEDDLPKDELLRIGRAIVEHLVPGRQGRLPDPRIQKIIDYATAHLDEPLSLQSASQGIYLSPSRLRHLFVEQTGLAFKTFVLWLRLVRAVQNYSEGGSLTEAAHEAGFSDSAHFSRIFKRTFGLPATTLTQT